MLPLIPAGEANPEVREPDLFRKPRALVAYRTRPRLQDAIHRKPVCKPEHPRLVSDLQFTGCIDGPDEAMTSMGT